MKGARIAVVADVHYGPDQGTKLGSRGLELLKAVLEEMEARRPDLLVDLGDRINEVDETADARHLRQVAATFAAHDVPRVHLLGNHDVDHLDRERNEEALGGTLAHQARVLGDWRLLFWNPDCRYVPRQGNLRLREEDLAWLDAALHDDERPTVLFSHAPAHRSPMDGNLYFERHPESRAWHVNVEEATRLLERHRQVLLCVNGHTHWNALGFRDGIAFTTLPSLTESFTTPPQPSAAWALLELGDPITWTVYGRDAMSWSLPLRYPRRSWLVREPGTRRLIRRAEV